MTPPYDPALPLRADATDDEYCARHEHCVAHCVYSTTQAFGVAREFAAACLAAERERVREAVEKLPRWIDGGFCDGDSGLCGAKMERDKGGKYLERNAVLTALLTPQPEKNRE